MSYSEYAEEVTHGGPSQGVKIRVTRRGIQVRGWYDYVVRMESLILTWAEVDAMRDRVNQVRPRTVPESEVGS